MAGSCAFSSSLSLALGSLRSLCWDTVQPARAIKGVEVKVPVRLSPRLERVIVWHSGGMAGSSGAGLESLSPFHPPCRLP